MAEISQKQKPRRGRVFPEIAIPPEELARRKAERTKLGVIGWHRQIGLVVSSKELVQLL